MPLPESGFTTDELEIARPGARKPGGDRVFKINYTGISARIDESGSFDRPVVGNEAIRTSITIVLINAHDSNDDVIDIQTGDRLRFPDFRGVLQLREVTLVRPIHIPGVGLDHLVLEVEPSG